MFQSLFELKTLGNGGASISLLKTLDYETQEMYSIQIIAKVSGRPNYIAVRIWYNEQEEDRQVYTSICDLICSCSFKKTG